MELSSQFSRFADDIPDLFQSVFAASEGDEEGKLIGTLASDLLKTTPSEDIAVFVASEDDTLLACAIFSRLFFGRDPRRVFILSPMAVHAAYQSKGIGQALLTFGLDALAKNSGDVAVTYGDPNYYRKVGFQPITEEFLQAPRRLQQPEGWLAKSLKPTAPLPFAERPRCAPALDDELYW